jgi:hypothetical protein
MHQNLSLTTGGRCSKCDAEADQLVSLRKHTTLSPGLCKRCAQEWPTTLTPEEELVRWHSQPNWDSAHELKSELAETRPELIWVECSTFKQLDQLMELRAHEDLDATRPVAAYIRQPEDANLEIFPNIQAFIIKAIATSCELHIILQGKPVFDSRPFYNFAEYYAKQLKP